MYLLSEQTRRLHHNGDHALLCLLVSRLRVRRVAADVKDVWSVWVGTKPDCEGGILVLLTCQTECFPTPWWVRVVKWSREMPVVLRCFMKPSRLVWGLELDYHGICETNAKEGMSPVHMAGVRKRCIILMRLVLEIDST